MCLVSPTHSALLLPSLVSEFYMCHLSRKYSGNRNRGKQHHQWMNIIIIISNYCYGHYIVKSILLLPVHTYVGFIIITIILLLFDIAM